MDKIKLNGNALISFLFDSRTFRTFETYFQRVFKDLILIQGLFKAHIKFKGFSRLRMNPVGILSKSLILIDYNIKLPNILNCKSTTGIN
jgi:hypothetical protein